MKLSLNPPAHLDDIIIDDTPDVESGLESLAENISSESIPLMGMGQPISEKSIYIIKSYDTETASAQVQIYILGSTTGISKNDIYEAVQALSCLKECDIVDIFFTCEGIAYSDALTLAGCISSCKAHVVTHASYIGSMGAVLAWFSGKELKVGVSSILRISHMLFSSCGELEDVKNSTSIADAVNVKILDSFVQYGLLTAEEKKMLIKNRKEINLYGDDLKSRVDKINNTKK
jgi:hypothetical protein